MTFIFFFIPHKPCASRSPPYDGGAYCIHALDVCAHCGVSASGIAHLSSMMGNIVKWTLSPFSCDRLRALRCERFFHADPRKLASPVLYNAFVGDPFAAPRVAQRVRLCNFPTAGRLHVTRNVGGTREKTRGTNGCDTLLGKFDLAHDRARLSCVVRISKHQATTFCIVFCSYFFRLNNVDCCSWGHGVSVPPDTKLIQHGS